MMMDARVRVCENRFRGLTEGDPQVVYIPMDALEKERVAPNINNACWKITIPRPQTKIKPLKEDEESPDKSDTERMDRMTDTALKGAIKRHDDRDAIAKDLEAIKSFSDRLGRLDINLNTQQKHIASLLELSHKPSAIEKIAELAENIKENWGG